MAGEMMTFPYTEGNPLSGIISYLTKRFEGNVEDKGVVKVLGQTKSKGAWVAPKNVADLDKDSYFTSGDETDQFIGYDFKQLKVLPTNYSIRSQWNGSKGYCNLKSWVIEQSNDGKTWIEIDRRMNRNQLDGRNLTATFPITTHTQCRFIRLRQIERNWWGSYSICISGLEIFGDLYGLSE
jgi:hypothetical protein